MSGKKRIAFIRPKDWPLANQIVEGVIRKQFSDYEVDLIDVTALVMRRPDIVLVNSLVTRAALWY